ncbi:uncharacterized protein LAESUDRAFT_54790 [Laetiporus sulphureus 93-53]|uniref:Uncharacterized protein n=1 Tax=Laetiporus sulphureus 93-53 TaxID=1314785 RepID=A0A165FCN7_9APHY|nr:uncharacterized protein LAESUDRAFT_54790 [Laetiporus sulphureus 93-53]KZT08767.1 hypothetical protein LAESUDRAFT_54790 [Laetiporus sulphureus 93-53]
MDAFSCLQLEIIVRTDVLKSMLPYNAEADFVQAVHASAADICPKQVSPRSGEVLMVSLCILDTDASMTIRNSHTRA